MRFDFSYAKNSFYITVLFVMGGMGVAFLSASFFFLGSYLSDPERVGGAVFIAIPFFLFGFFSIWYGTKHFLVFKKFYASNEWYGIDITQEYLYFTYFEAWKRTEVRVPLKEVQNVKLGYSKGQHLVFFRNKSTKQFTIPCKFLNNTQIQRLVYALERKEIEEHYLFRYHLEIVEALMLILEKQLPVSFIRSWKQYEPEHFVFGLTEGNTQVPIIELRILGGGDTYSGFFDYLNSFEVKQLQIEDMPVRLHYTHQSTNLAGDCSLFTTSFFSEDELHELESTFYTLLRAGIQLPEIYDVLLP